MGTLRLLPGWLYLAVMLIGVTAAAAPTQDKKDEKKEGKKDDKPKVEPNKDERIYPKVDAVLELKGHTDWVNRVLFMPDGKHLLTAGRDKTLRIWDSASGKEVRLIKDLQVGAVALALSPDGLLLATTAGKWNKEKQHFIGEISLFDARTGKLARTIQGHAEPIGAVAFHPTAKQLATASNDGTLKVWDSAAGKEVHSLKGHTGPVTCVVYSADGKLLVSGGEDKTVRIWDAADGKEIKTLKGPARAISSLTFSRDGKYLAAASLDGTVTLWDAVEWKELRVLKADEGLLAVVFSPDGAKLATGGWENVVQIWDVESGKELGGLAGHTQPISSVIFTPAGDQVVSASLDQTVRIWNVSAAKQKVEAPKKEEEKKTSPNNR
jgi:eukaryotic-like serine/threonine-protein kinase